MKKLFIVALLLISAVSFGQVVVAPYTKPSNPYGVVYNRTASQKVILMPTGCGNPAPLTGADSAMKQRATYLDSCAHRDWLWDPKLNTWDSIHIGVAAAGGSTTFAGLTDVNLTSLANGQLPKYNSGTGKWENFTPSYLTSTPTWPQTATAGSSFSSAVNATVGSNNFTFANTNSQLELIGGNYVGFRASSATVQLWGSGLFINTPTTNTGLTVALGNHTDQTRIVGQRGANNALGYLTAGYGQLINSGNVRPDTGVLFPAIRATISSNNNESVVFEMYKNTAMTDSVMLYVYRDSSDVITRLYEPIRNNDVRLHTYTDKFPFDSDTCINNTINDVDFINVSSDVIIRGCTLETMIIDGGSFTGLKLINHNQKGTYGEHESVSEIVIFGNNVSFLKNNIKAGTFFNECGVNSIFEDITAGAENLIFCNGFTTTIRWGIFNANSEIQSRFNGGGIDDFYIGTSCNVYFGSTVYTSITMGESTILGTSTKSFVSASGITIEDYSAVKPDTDNAYDLVFCYFGTGLNGTKAVTITQSYDGFSFSNYSKYELQSLDVTIGDILPSGNGTKLLIDDATQKISIIGALEVGPTNSIVGTATNNNATAGHIGEEITSTVSTYTNYTTTATYQNVTSIALTAGDWDISVFYTYSSNSATITAGANAIFVVSTTTASAAGATEGLNISYVPQAALLGTSLFSDAITSFRVSLSGTTTYYLNTQATFTLGNPQYVGTIRARRMR